MASFLKKPKFILPVLILIAVSLIFSSGKLSKTKDKVSSISEAGELLSKSDTSEVHSPDGEMKVIMKKVLKAEGNLSIYTFTVSDIEGNNSKIIYSTTLPDGLQMEIPENSWSPDNKYLFLKETDGQNEAFFVFRANGESFSDGKTFIDVGPLFIAKITDYKLDEITGWDSETLLHVFTVSNEGRGPSYWFDVEYRNFLMLGSR